MSIKPDRAIVIEAEIPTPKIAEITGSPAAIKDPSITNKTMAAVIRPTISPMPNRSPKLVVNACENSTWMPCSRSSESFSTTPLVVTSSTTFTGTVNWMVAMAVRPLLETVPKFSVTTDRRLPTAINSLFSSISARPSASFASAASSSTSPASIWAWAIAICASPAATCCKPPFT